MMARSRWGPIWSFRTRPGRRKSTRCSASIANPTPTVDRWNGAVAILAVQGSTARSVLERLFGWQTGPTEVLSRGLVPCAFVERGRPPPGERKLRSPRISKLEFGSAGRDTPASLATNCSFGERTPRRSPHRLVGAGIPPCGLGARDTLRLEKGYLLSGQDFHQDRTPLEAGQDRFVEFDHPFVGREALERQQKSRDSRPARRNTNRASSARFPVTGRRYSMGVSR